MCDVQASDRAVEFVDAMVSVHGCHFQHVQVSNEVSHFHGPWSEGARVTRVTRVKTLSYRNLFTGIMAGSVSTKHAIIRQLLSLTKHVRDSVNELEEADNSMRVLRRYARSSSGGFHHILE